MHPPGAGPGVTGHVVVIVSTLLVAAAHAARVPAVFGGRVTCVPQSGVQFCEGGLATRVQSFDGVPLGVLKRAFVRSMEVIGEAAREVPEKTCLQFAAA